MEFTRETYIHAFIQLSEDTQSAIDTAAMFGDSVFDQSFLIERSQTAVAVQQRWKREGDGTDLVTIVAQAITEYNEVRKAMYDAQPISSGASRESRYPDDDCFD